MLDTLDGSVAVPAVVAELVEQVRPLATAEARQVLAAFDAGGDGQVLHGAVSTQAWLRGACRVTGAEAAERVRIARASRDLLADPFEQVGDGALTYEHLRAVDKSVRHLPRARQPQAVELLTDLAQVGSVGDVPTAGQHLRTSSTPTGRWPTPATSSTAGT